MVDQTNNTEAKAAAEAPAKVAEATADTAVKLVEEGAKAGKRARATATRRAKRSAKAATAAKRTTARRAKTTKRKAAKAAPRTERIETVNSKTTFPAFDAFPAVPGFQNLFADAGERSQEAVRRSQKLAEELADITRGNVEALAESGRLAAEGARSLSRDVIAKSREGVEEAADAIRTLAEAKSPTEFVQLQSEIARASFDRLVAQSSRFTESWVKLAGEAVQPLSSRASANAERVNSFVA
jgi:phasin family protein